jgi:thiol-disulfide isomerase/thioredoxin
MVENSKTLLGEKLDLGNVAKHLGDARLSEFAKSPGTNDVILVFWSSTCIPCLQELPKLSEQYPGGLVVPINTDNKDEQASAKTSLQLLAPDFPFLHDADRFLEKSLKIRYLPTLITVDPEGIIKKFTAGAN